MADSRHQADSNPLPHHGMLKVIKSSQKTILNVSVLFQLLVMVGARKMLDRVFDKSELRILDDVLPESQRKEKLDDEDLMEELEVIQKAKIAYSFS